MSVHIAKHEEEKKSIHLQYSAHSQKFYVWISVFRKKSSNSSHKKFVLFISYTNINEDILKFFHYLLGFE